MKISGSLTFLGNVSLIFGTIFQIFRKDFYLHTVQLKQHFLQLSLLVIVSRFVFILMQSLKRPYLRPKLNPPVESGYSTFYVTCASACVKLIVAATFERSFNILTGRSPLSGLSVTKKFYQYFGSPL